jgi:hypothetical protein
MPAHSEKRLLDFIADEARAPAIEKHHTYPVKTHST